MRGQGDEQSTLRGANRRRRTEQRGERGGGEVFLQVRDVQREARGAAGEVGDCLLYTSPSPRDS